MIGIARIDHVGLRVRDLREAAPRWALQFGLTERHQNADRALLACDYEPFSLELVPADEPGHDHTAFELRPDCSLEAAQAHLRTCGIEHRLQEGSLFLADPEDNPIELVPHQERPVRWVAHARMTTSLGGFHPRKLGHVNFLTANIGAAAAFYTEVLGMRVTDWLGDGGVWFNVNSDHHVMALIDKGTSRLHHLAFDMVDWGMLRVAFDHLAQHGRWLGWGPVRHGVGGNLCGYVRIVEEPCFVELYCDMEQLPPDHEPRLWPDDRFSSNTWGPLPPRSYFRFDTAAIESERRSLETLGIPLPEELD